MNRDLSTRLLGYYGIALFISLLYLQGCDSRTSPNSGGSSSGSAPSSPTGVSASSGSAKGTIKVQWDGVKEAGSYIIYSSTAPGIENNKFKSKKRMTKPNFTISDLTSGKIYYFTVTALNGSGESKMSVEVSATAP
jgi:fibronectin type 3 domain-containing protein